MTTVERIDVLLESCGRKGTQHWGKPLKLHEILNLLDGAIGADTEWLSSLECSCLWHIGKACHNRRAVGARLKMLEEFVALNAIRAEFA